MPGFAVAAQAEFVVMIGDECLHLVTKPVRFRGFRNFIPKHAFTRYRRLTIDSLVKRDHGPSAEGPASFHAARWTLATP